MREGTWTADLELALGAAEVAARRIMQDFRTDQEVFYKSPTQPQTEADREADRILRQLLLADRPDYGWLSEETADHPSRLERERVWIVDPIDGTRSYLSGSPQFAISIALAVCGQVVLGVIANPATGEYFFASTGAGAFSRLDHQLSVSSKDQLNQATLAASRSEIKSGEFEAFRGDVLIVPTGSTAYKLARVASGEADIFLSRGPKSEWDIAAGDLIVREAGGSVSDLTGSSFSYNRPDPQVNGIVASNGQLHSAALGLVDLLPEQH